MVRDLGKYDRDDEIVPQDEGGAEQENQASDEQLAGEPSETSSEPSPDTDDVGDIIEIRLGKNAPCGIGGRVNDQDLGFRGDELRECRRIEAESLFFIQVNGYWLCADEGHPRFVYGKSGARIDDLVPGVNVGH